MSGALRLVVSAAAAFLVVVPAVFVGCSWAHPDASTRLARSFALADTSGEERVREQLTARFPAGTPEDSVRAFLARSGVADDPRSSVNVDEAQRVVGCRIDYDTASPALVKASWSVVFRFGADRRLTDIVVKQWWTGL